MIYYSGIGSRETPNEILDDMFVLGVWFAELGYTLRSGNANGADVAFGRGCDYVDGNSEIYLPYDNFNGGCRNSIHVKNSKLLKRASTIMKSLKSQMYTWNSRNTPYHQRNVFQVIGVNLNTQSSFVVCYTDTGAETEKQVIERNDTSGTSTAITLADRLSIPVVNMYNKDWLSRIENILKELK